MIFTFSKRINFGKELILINTINLIVWLKIYPPYQKFLNNFSVFANHVLTIVFTVWLISRDYNEILRTEIA